MMTSFSRTPDKPQSFGFKVSWFAVAASDPSLFVDALGLKEAEITNWSSGLEAVYARRVSQEEEPWVFVSPPVSGWVLAVSEVWPYPVTIETNRDIGRKFDGLFSRLMCRFNDVQFFGSHRVADFAAWARAQKGSPVRIFSYGDDVMANVGSQSAEEAQLRFTNLSGLSPLDATDKIFDLAEAQEIEVRRLIATGLSGREARAKFRQSQRSVFPQEMDVVELARLWSIDPTRLSERDHPPGLGLAVRLPSTLRQ